MNKNIHSVSTFQTEWFTKKKASKSSGARHTLCQKSIDVIEIHSQLLYLNQGKFRPFVVKC